MGTVYLIPDHKSSLGIPEIFGLLQNLGSFFHNPLLPVLSTPEKECSNQPFNNHFVSLFSKLRNITLG